MNKDTWKIPYDVLLSNLETLEFEISDILKNGKRISQDDVKSYRVKINGLLIFILTGLRFKVCRKGVECKFKPFAKYPNKNNFTNVFSLIAAATTLMKMLERAHGVHFNSFNVSTLRTLNDVRHNINNLMYSDLSSDDFAYIYQLRLNASRNTKIIIACLAGIVLVGLGILCFFTMGSDSSDDSDSGIIDDSDNGEVDDSDNGYDLED